MLLAEDNPINQRLAVTLLNKRGHRVTVVGNGEEALNKLAEESFDLVLMDIQMPVMGGFEATQRIREREKAQGGHAVIIAMTANAMQGDRERCLEAGMDGYVSKPVKVEQLFSEIALCLPEAVLLKGEQPAETTQLDLGLGESSATPSVRYNRALVIENLGGDIELFNSVVDMYISDNAGYQAALKAAVIAGDAETLQREAHTVKGVLATFTYEDGATLARRIETLAKEGDFAAASALVPQLTSVLSDFAEILLVERSSGG